jgi:phenylacetate-CoA ligase
MRRMAKITGRSDDMLIVRGVNLFPMQVEEQILRCAGLRPHYRIDVERIDRLDQVTVLVEASSEAPQSQKESAGAELRAHIKDLIGVTVQVEVCDPGTIERSTGKASRVRDLRQ